MNPLLKSLLWLDRVVNVILGGNSRETLSSRAHRMDVKNQPYWGWTAGAINKLFFWQPNHCRLQWEYEQAHPFTDPLLHVYSITTLVSLGCLLTAYVVYF